ncbi:protease inhibitor I42 family protein [Candidatus Binatia bacterium]|nr:protease inhibitor I42 family protein [Candidatus Binatia bacterium]
MACGWKRLPLRRERGWPRWFLVAAVAAGCAAGGTGEIAAGGTAKVTVPAGREFVVSRDSSPSTGYKWRLAAPLDARVIELVRDEYQPGPESRLGAPGVQLWTFKAVGPGTATLILEYARPWETGVAPARRDEVTVTVESR